MELRPDQVLPLSRQLQATPDPLALFAALRTGTAGQALLESADASTRAGLRSILVASSAVRATCHGDAVTLEALTDNGRHALGHLEGALKERADHVERTGEDTIRATYPSPRGIAAEAARRSAPSPVDALRAMVEAFDLVVAPTSPAMLTAGAFAYDFVSVYEEMPQAASDPLGFPDYVFFLPESLVLLDHARGSAQVVSYVFGGSGADRRYHDAARQVASLTDLCTRPLEAPTSTSSAAPADVTVDASDEAYASSVRALKEHILAGDVFQVVPSRTFRAPCPDPLASYARLRRSNPSPYMFFLDAGPHVLFGASPETAVKVERGEVELRPIAGTRKRGRGPDGELDHDLDARIEAELRADVKELAEHMMLVDLARNDVARISVPGTRRVERLLTVERYAHVMHLVSAVRGRLRPELDALGAYIASMNMGTLTGAPKVRAAHLLRTYEPTRRGPYGGAIGYVTREGDLDTAIIIRSAVVHEGTAYVRAGAGVVHDSVPLKEADETARKARSVLRAITAQEGAP